MYLNPRIRRFLALGLLFTFLGNGLALPAHAQLALPAPGQMVALSHAFSPVVLKGIKLDPKDPMRLHFFVDQGDSPDVIPAKAGIQTDTELRRESEKLIKYFLASLAIPERDLWVNLSPYEKDRIVPQQFGRTEMGRDLLAQDYLLKQITASLIYPENELGKTFWAKVYQEAQAKYGTTNIPVNTFNKVWIVPEKAVVYEKDGTAFVLENKLKVMLEEDYLALANNRQPRGHVAGTASASNVSPSPLPSDAGLNTKASQGNLLNASPNINTLGSQIVREIVIPALTKEVNEGKNFAQLRQVFYSLILATWYKKKIKDSILNKVYADKNKIKGLSFPNASVGNPETIYKQYLTAFKKGVYNYIKEEQDSITNQTIPRKYFSGGVQAQLIAPAIEYVQHVDLAQLSSKRLMEVDGNVQLINKVSPDHVPDSAMNAELKNLWEIQHQLGNRLNSIGAQMSLLEQEVRSKQLISDDFSILRRLSKISEPEEGLFGILIDEAGVDDYGIYFSQIRNHLENFRSTLREVHDKEIRTMPQYQRLIAALNDTIDNFLPSVSRGEFDFSKVEKKKISLKSVINAATSYMAKTENIHKEYSDLLGEVSVDPFKLGEVIINLVKNAQDAIEETGQAGEITIKTEREDNWAKVIISDNGPGIAPDILPKIFEPYFTTKGDKGTGLGLDIVKQIINAHGGTIGVESALGKGTTFTIRLPMDRAMSGEQKIIFPENIQGVIPNDLGEKPEKLIKLKQSGFNVPRFFIIKSDGSGRLVINDELRQAFDRMKKPAIVRSAHPEEGRKHSYSGVFESFPDIKVLSEAEANNPIQKQLKDEFVLTPIPESVEGSYSEMVSLAKGGDYRIGKYRKAKGITDFNPNMMNAVVMEQVNVDVFGMFVTSDQQHPDKVHIHFQVRGEEDNGAGGVITYDKTTHMLENNTLSPRLQSILTQFGETASKIEQKFGVQQIEISSSKEDGKVYVLQSRNINLGNPQDVPRYAQYKTMSTTLTAVGYGSYHAPVLVVEALNEATGYKESSEYEELRGQFWKASRQRNESEIKLLNKQMQKLAQKANEQYRQELLTFQQRHPDFILVIKDAEAVIDREDGRWGVKNYDFLNRLISTAKVVIRGRDQNAIRHEDWEQVEHGGITILPGMTGSFVAAFRHKKPKDDFDYPLTHFNDVQKKDGNVSLQYFRPVATGDYLNVLSNTDGIYVWYDNAQLAEVPGGIDFDPAQMGLDVQKEGKGFQFDGSTGSPQWLWDIDAQNITGAEFVIRRMAPVTNLPSVLGLNIAP